MEANRHGTGHQFSRRDLLRAAAVAPVAGWMLIPSGCSPSQTRVAAAAQTPTVRILVLENRQRVDLNAAEPATLHVGPGTAEQVPLAAGSSVPVLYTGNGWRVGDFTFGSGELTVQSAAEGSVSVDGHAYRGNYRFVPRPGGKVDVVNDVDVDGYLMGVVAREMYPNWHEEAYRAQAIAARTYSLYVTRTTTLGAHFDLFADTRSQVYGGIPGESPKSRAAVEATRGWVVAYGPQGNERIFKAYYSSCCGGITQSAAAAFGEPPLEPLTEQSIGPRCAACPRFSWPAVVLSRSEITRRLRTWGANNNAPEKTIGNVATVEIATTNTFGRPATFAVTDTRGYRYMMGCEDLRIAMNTDATDGVKLSSSFCRPVNEPDAVRFTDGHGFGHGVGLCQWCSQEQATAGVPYKQIVLGAFPKAVMVKAY